ncbi:MAG: undecaprenyl-diphosphate phosphatase [Pyramidobacter sp.]|jgi:undecaprenyl-diphosphatase
MSEFFSTVVQGLLQGVTEFLPVSSSAHLAIYQHVTSAKGAGLFFDLILHVSTLCATLVYFRKDIVRLLMEFFGGFGSSAVPKAEGWYFGWSVIVGSVPTALIGLLVEPLVQSAGTSMRFVGAALLMTSALLMSLNFIPRGTAKICITIGLVVGVAQGLAVFPGISRSGATLAAGLLCGLSAAEAFRFSFLLSLPAIAGATLLEMRHAGALVGLPSGSAAAVAVAFVAGLLSLYVLHRTVISGKWKIFSFYCATLGLTALLWL